MHHPHVLQPVFSKCQGAVKWDPWQGVWVSPVQDGSGDGVASSTVDASGDAPAPGKKPAMEQLLRSGSRAPTGTLAADEERADLAESSGAALQRQPFRWPGQRVVGPVIG